jgi:hypothetical protein
MMKTLRSGGRSALAVVLGAASALVAFGLLLALAWLLPLSDNRIYRLATLIIVTGLSLIASGYLSATLAGRERVKYGFALGGVVGGVGFGYIFGPTWWLALAIPLSALMGGAGGWLANWQPTRGQPADQASP